LFWVKGKKNFGRTFDAFGLSVILNIYFLIFFDGQNQDFPDFLADGCIVIFMQPADGRLDLSMYIKTCLKQAGTLRT
jgi:hypothetical protein